VPGSDFILAPQNNLGHNSINWSNDGKRYRRSTARSNLCGIAFRDIQPALKEPGSPDRFVTYGEAIYAGESPLLLGRLMEKAYQITKQYSRHLKWISSAFAQLHKQGETGHRKAGYYRDKALSSLAQRVTQTGHDLALDVEGLLREMAGAGYVPQAADIEQGPDVAQTPEAVPGWATQPSLCVDDYRAYELRDIERLQ
jgi:hypothetical protein